MHLLTTPQLAILLAPLVLWAVLFVLAEYGHVVLKPLKPWLVAACWLLWGVYGMGVVANRPWRFALFSVYCGTSLILLWLKRRYLFASNEKPSHSLARFLTVPKPTYVAVRDVAAASPWYTDKLGLRELAPSEETRRDRITLKFSADTDPLILVPKDPILPRSVPVLFSRRIRKVRERLIANGVSAGPVQQDRQGTTFFELRDGEGNTIEVSEQP